MNNQAEELYPIMETLKELKAPYGVYSILGNHDVGDYRRWATIKEKEADIKTLIATQQAVGIIMLIDENVLLKKGNDSMALIGVNSWENPPFNRYGNLKKAMKGIENISFKILITHSPSHWDEEVMGKTDISLTLSGHTHAMQMGINCCGLFWSPMAWFYQHWAGLYKYNEQYLNVNRGFGYVGFPGRIGMTPEITIIELKRKQLP